MNLLALPRSRRLGDKLTAASVGYLVVAPAAVGMTLEPTGTALLRIEFSTPKEPAP